MGLITHATADNIHGASAPRGRFRLYTLPGVENALNQPAEANDDACLPPHTLTEQQSRLTAILERGETGSWRGLATPDLSCLAGLDRLDVAAPIWAR